MKRKKIGNEGQAMDHTWIWRENVQETIQRKDKTACLKLSWRWVVISVSSFCFNRPVISLNPALSLSRRPADCVCVRLRLFAFVLCWTIGRHGYVWAQQDVTALIFSLSCSSNKVHILVPYLVLLLPPIVCSSFLIIGGYI